MLILKDIARLHREKNKIIICNLILKRSDSGLVVYQTKNTETEIQQGN